MTMTPDPLREALQAAANYIDTLGGDSKAYRAALAAPSAPAEQTAAQAVEPNEDHHSPAALAEMMQRLADQRTSQRYAEVLRKTCGVIAEHLRVLAAQPAKVEPQPVDYNALVSAAWTRHKYRQGTGLCIAFKHGAEWQAECAAPPAQAVAQPLPDELLVKVRRLVEGFEHVSGLARLWEPDYSSGSERALWARATEACADVAKLLNSTLAGRG